jgi:ATP-dependent Clp protease ATP-binding subunit ClpC
VTVTPPGFDRLTRRARASLAHAQSEAAALHHTMLAPAHLLLGLLDEPAGVAARVLQALGISLEGARAAVALSLASRSTTPSAVMDTTASEALVAAALEEADRLQHHYVGTEHLLLGLVGPQVAEIMSLLALLGATPDQVRSGVLRMLRTGSPNA